MACKAENLMQTVAYLALALFLSLAGNAYQWRHAAVERATVAEQAKTEFAKSVAVAQQTARDEEAKNAAASAAVAQSYERGKTDAQATADRVAAGLRAGTLKLRNQWQGCEASRPSQTITSAAESYAAERSRQDSASRIVRAAAQCDAQVASLQSLILADRGMK